MGTPEEDEEAKLRAEVLAEMEAEESGELPPIVETPIVETPIVETPPPPANPWEGVDPVLKQAFDDLTSKVQTLTATETRLKQAESRIGAITNELHTAKVEAQEAPSPGQIAAAAASDEKWEALKKDFPEWADAFDSRFDTKLGATVQELKTTLKAEMAKEIVPPKQDDLEVRLLSVMKPGWRKIIVTPEWSEWLHTQPPEKAAMIHSDKAEDAISLLTEFEKRPQQQAKTASEIAAERKQRLKTSELPQGGKATPPKSEQDMSPAELRASIGKEVFTET
jgi:hypothetical protein